MSQRYEYIWNFPILGKRGCFCSVCCRSTSLEQAIANVLEAWDDDSEFRRRVRAGLGQDFDMASRIRLHHPQITTHPGIKLIAQEQPHQ